MAEPRLRAFAAEDLLERCQTALGERVYTFDRTGIFGGDLIIITLNDNVWRINAQGTATQITTTKIPSRLSR